MIDYPFEKISLHQVVLEYMLLDKNIKNYDLLVVEDEREVDNSKVVMYFSVNLSVDFYPNNFHRGTVDVEYPFLSARPSLNP